MRVHELVSDELWAAIEPLLPHHPLRPKGGRPPVEDRAALCGILFVLRTGIQWRMLPQELGCSGGVTCWRRLRDWTRAGVWHRLHRVLLDRPGEAGAIDWARACLDSTGIPAKQGGDAVGTSPTDRGKPGTRRHLPVDRQGTPLALGLREIAGMTAACSRRSSASRSRPGRAGGTVRRYPAKLHADKGYDYPTCRAALAVRDIVDRIARRGTEAKQRLGHR